MPISVGATALLTPTIAFLASYSSKDIAKSYLEYICKAEGNNKGKEVSNEILIEERVEKEALSKAGQIVAETKETSNAEAILESRKDHVDVGRAIA